MSAGFETLETGPALTVLTPNEMNTWLGVHNGGHHIYEIHGKRLHSVAVKVCVERQAAPKPKDGNMGRRGIIH